MIRKIPGIILAACLFLFFSWEVFSQEETIVKEVHVVKPYEPTISDAFKLNFLPRLDDTIKIVPAFNYSIFPSKLINDFNLKPISAARMVGEPLTKLYKSNLKIGAGNYVTTLLELDMNNLRSKEHSIGAYLKHMSSNGKIKLDNGEKITSGYGENIAQVFGKKFYRKSILSGDAGYFGNKLFYYGYNTDADTLTNIDTLLNKDNIKHSFFGFNVNTSIKSTHVDSTHLNYNVTLNYDFIGDKDKNFENGFNLNTKLNKFIRKESEIIGINADLKYFNKSQSIDTSDNILVNINPWVCRFNSEWRVSLGIDFYSDIASDATNNYLFPKAIFEFNVIDYFLIPYLGIDGGLQVNNYKRIVQENMFIDPGLHVKNSALKKIIYGGIKGNFSSNISFNFLGKYSVVENMFFYVNDTNDVLGNKFNVVYDDIDILNIYGEVSLNQMKKLSFLFKGNYYKYTMKDEEKPWHKPEYDFSLSTKYNMRDKILIVADIFVIGDRYAKSYKSGENYVMLDSFVDLNLSFEYRYTKILSGFIKFNNITSAKNYLWNQYPAQGFNILFGFTYAL